MKNSTLKMEKKREKIDLDSALEEAKKWLLEAGKYQLSQLGGQNLRIETKTYASDLVTRVDKETEKFITEKIKERYPHTSIVAEEGENCRPEDHSLYTWVLDPLDGTTNFVHGFPIFSISLALTKQSVPVLGVVYLPYLQDLFWAVDGKGSFRNGKKLSISTQTELSGALLATGFPYDKHVNTDNNLNYTAQLVPQIQCLRRTGSAAFDLACVASGNLDGYWEMMLKPWDFMAGAVLVKEAGGLVVFHGKDRRFFIVAGNSIMVDKIRQQLEFVDRTNTEKRENHYAVSY